MPRPSQGSIPSELGWLVDTLDDYERRLRTLEAPSGEALGNTVAKLSALVANIQAQLDAYLGTRYTNSQIDAVAANAVTSALGGNVTIGGAFYAPNAYNTDITWARRTGWWGNDGRAGYASSSRRKKTAIVPADEEALAALLDVQPVNFRYRAEVARRTALRINDGVDYVPPVELGLIAEDLDAAGLSSFVYYDEDGQPEGIEYGMLTVALLAIARSERAARTALEQRVDRLERGE